MKNNVFIISIAAIVAVFVVLICVTSKPRENKALKQQVSSTLKTPFDAKATIKMKDLVLVADINRTGVGCATIKIQEPQTLKDMMFQYNGDDIKVGYKGLSVKLDEKSRLVSSLVSMIVNSIDKAASGSGINVKVDGNALYVSGENESGKFYITMDKEKRSVASITLPELEFECNLDNFAFK